MLEPVVRLVCRRVGRKSLWTQSVQKWLVVEHACVAMHVGRVQGTCSVVGHSELEELLNGHLSGLPAPGDPVRVSGVPGL